MSELPAGWEATTLDDLSEVITKGTTPKTLGFQYQHRGIRFVKAESLANGSIDASACAYIEEAAHAALRRSQLKEHDVLFTIAGTLGRVATVSAADLPANTNQAVAIIRLREPLLAPYVASFSASEAAMLVESGGRGTGLQNLNLQQLGEFPIRVPPLPEQRRIVVKIDSLTGKSKRARDHLDHIPRLVEKYKQAVLVAAFRGDLTREWRKARNHGAWQNVSIADVALSVFDGPFGSNLKTADYTEAGIRVVRLENIGHLSFLAEKKTFISIEKYSGLERHTLQPDDVLVSSFVADTMRVCLFPSGLPTKAINKADCFSVRPNVARCLPRFLALRLSSSATYDTLEEAVHGATRPRISLSQLRAHRFELPSLDEQMEIVRRIQSAFAWIDHLASDATSACSLINHLDQAVLAKAFRGELVPQDPADEPASVLLNRIRAEREAASKSKRGRKAKAEA